MTSEEPKTLRLNGEENYAVWRFQLSVLLKASGEYNLIKAAKPTEANELERWTKADGNAQKLIVTSVSEKALSYLMGCQSAKEMLDKLESLYGKKGDSSLNILQQKFYSCVFDHRTGMAEHITKLQNLVFQMKLLKENVSDQMLMSKILMTLPSEYAHFHSAWDSTSENEKTLENLTARLLLEEERLRCREESVALATRMKKVSLHSSNPVKCYHCGKMGHLKKNCFSLRNSKNSTEQSQQSTSTSSSSMKCFNCGKAGHIKRFCFSRNQPVENKVKNHASEEKTSKACVGNALVSVDSDKNRTCDWYLDTAATDHMCSTRRWFQNYVAYDEPKYVKLGDDSRVTVEGYGNIYVRTYVGKKSSINYLENVLYVPELIFNLYSARKTTKKGFKLEVDANKCRFIKNDETVVEGDMKGAFWVMNIAVVDENEKLLSVSEDAEPVALAVESLQLWHERLAHQNFRQVRSVLNSKNVRYKNDQSFCDACANGKMHRLPFPVTNTRTTTPGEIIHSDVCGPMETLSIGGSKYFVLFKDDFSHFRTVYFLRCKREVREKLAEYIKSVETDTGHRVKVIRTDRGKEDVNKDVRDILKSFGIRHQLTTGYAPEQNGSAEREMRTIVEGARTLLCSKSLPKTLWAEAVNTVVYVLNRTGTSSVKNKSPYQLWFNKEPDVSHLRVFGTEVYVHVPKVKRKKWDAKSRSGIFVGYDENVKGYKVWHKPNEMRFYHDILFKDEEPDKNFYSPIFVEPPDDDTDEKEAPENSVEDVDEEEKGSGSSSETYCYNLRDRTKLLKPARFSLCTVNSELIEPATYDEAVHSKDREQWLCAMSEEMDHLNNNETWELCELPSGRSALGNKWVYKIKLDSNGKIERYKARLVVQGCFQRYGFDYTETFSPVAKFESLRVALSLAAMERMELLQFDVTTAFLYADLNEEIFMKQPRGFEDGSQRVCKLRKSLYGLKQAPRKWNEKFTNFLKKFSLVSSEADPCIFHNKNLSIIILVYVDDGIVIHRDSHQVRELLEAMKNEFKITVGPVDRYLGIEIEQLNDGSIFITQSGYARKLLQRFGMEEAKPVKTPLDEHTDLNAAESKEAVGVPFRELVGSLMFLATCTRPDLMFALSKISQFMQKPKFNHWTALKRILRYIRGTEYYGILYKSEGEGLIGYSDSDFAGDTSSRKSTTGYVFLNAGGAVSWCSRKQSTVSLSTTEAEYVAASEATKEATWLKLLAAELLPHQKGPILLNIDNQSAIKLVKNPEMHKRTKHIDIKYHFIRQKLEENTISVAYISTGDQIADIFTKPLHGDRFAFLRSKLGVIEKEDI